MADAWISRVQRSLLAARTAAAAAERRVRRRFDDEGATRPVQHCGPVQSADVRERMAHAVKQAAANDVDEGEQVSLAALLGLDEHDRTG